MKFPSSLAALALASSLLVGLAAAGRPSNAFFALSNGTKDAGHTTPESQVAMLKELGYQGISCSGAETTPEMFAALDRYGLKMFTVYLGLSLDGDKPPVDPALAQVLPLLKGRDTILWLYIRSTKLKPSDPAGDARAVQLIRQVADQAAAQELRVALYPHVWFWLERVEDAVRLAQKADRKNVGATFNLCHWLIKDGPEGARQRLQRARPYLMVVTINGTSWDVTVKNREGWIQTLDRGTFDVGSFMQTLREVGFSGPVGLQSWSIKGDARDNLSRSMAAWRKMSQ